MEKRIPEKELILPSLFLMSLNKNGIITTRELIPKLREIMKPPPKDLETNKNRQDDRFSQKVRNLKSHNTFEKDKFAKYVEKDKFAKYVDGHFEITDKGKIHLQKNQEILNYLLANDFDYLDLTDSLKTIENNQNKNIETFDENVIIQEGRKKLVEKSVYERSAKLRNYAIKYFTENSKINCHCCKFNFQDFYGEHGKEFIEIHHTKPIFKFEDDDLECTIKEAIKNLIPVCSNCHRMIHRNWKKPIEIQILIESIKSNGLWDK